MKPGLKNFLFCGACCVLTSCTTPSSGPVAITKVNPYHLQTAKVIKSEDPMIKFEQKRRLYGSIEEIERKDLYGNYFTIFWKSKARSPATVRFEYRQGGTGPTIHVQEMVVDEPKHSNTTEFRIVGDDYHENGKVTQWKASVVENGSVVAEYKSYLWQ